MSFILVTGNATLDIVNVVGHYPHEDEEMRAIRQWVDMGGNAMNLVRVLAAHHHRCDWAGVVANDADGQRIMSYAKAAGIDLDYVSYQTGSSPVSYITLNQQNGSRTIVHHRDLPELSADYFGKIPVAHYDWLHFEGRNVSELEKMLAYTRANIFDQPVSLEIEKARKGLEELIPLVDIAMFSGVYAQSQGFVDAESFLRDRQRRYGDTWMTCTWGAQGAWAVDQLGVVFHAAAPETTAIDTIGAGDVFNAGLIHALATGKLLEEALHYATELAGRKVMQQGFAGLP